MLQKHWPNVPIYDDVCTLTKERLEADGIGTIDIIHGGYPCQPFSTAGERKGKDDDRHLWPEVARILEENRPRWFVGENVAGHVSLGLDDVLSDLGDIGYTAQSFIIPASSVGALHRRDRVFIVAHADGIGRLEHKGFSQKIQQTWNEVIQREEIEQSNMQQHVYSGNKDVADTNSKRRSTDIYSSLLGKQEIQRRKDGGSIEDWSRRSMLFEPKLLRGYHGFPSGMDRNRALGNAVVPQQIYPILAAIKKIDDILHAA